MSENEIVKAEAAQAPAIYDGPSGLADNISTADLHLPRVALLQALSPQVQNEPEKYKQGQFINTLTQDVLPEPLIFTPVLIFRNVICWRPRSEGGGMLWKSMNFKDPKVQKAISWDGNKKPTADQYVNAVCLLPNDSMPVIISFCKTSLKAGLDLATFALLSGQAWKYQYELQSTKTKNDKGTYYVMRVKRAKENAPGEINAALSLYANIKGMAIDTDYEGATAETNVTGAEPEEF